MKRIIVRAAAFIIGLFMILGRIRISRYVSDLNGIFTVGIILSIVSGLGLFLNCMEGENKTTNRNL